MSIEFKRPLHFIKIINSLDLLCKDITFAVHDNGIFCDLMDTSQVVFIKFVMNPEYFTSFDVTDSCTISVDLANLKRILKMHNDTDKLFFNVSNKDSLGIVISGTNNIDCSLSLMDIDQESLTVPPIENINEVKLNSTEFKNIIGNMIDNSEELTFTIENDTELQMITKSEFCKININIKTHTSITFVEESTITVSSRYLKILTKFDKSICDTVSVCIINEMPLMVIYPFPNNEGLINFFVAPKLPD